MLNENMTSYFHNGALFHFFEFLTTLARHSVAFWGAPKSLVSVGLRVMHWPRPLHKSKWTERN